MSFRLDTTRRFTGALLAALLVVALAVPACMTLMCIASPMSGDGVMGGMSVTECLDAVATHDALLASQGSALTIVMAFVALLGLVVVNAFSARLTAVGLVPAPASVGPPPPVDPRGERLLL